MGDRRWQAEDAEGFTSCRRHGEGHKEQRAGTELRAASEEGAVGEEGSRCMGEGGGTEARGVPDATIESRGGESTSSSEGGGGAMESGERTKGEGKGAAEMAHA